MSCPGAENEGAKVVHCALSKLIIDVSGRATLLPVHRAETARVQIPFKDLGSTLAERIAQALLDPSAETVQ